MRPFQFARTLRKYFQPYTLIRESGSGAYIDGKYVPAAPQRDQLQGSIQPVNARLRAIEGGSYTETDRMLYTAAVHESGDRLEHQGVQYTVAEEAEREYSDINQYLLRKVVVNGTV